MSDSGKPPTGALRASPAEAWLGVCDELLWALDHALSNRLAALLSLATLLEHTGRAGDSLLGVLGREIGELERTVALLKLLPRNARHTAEPVRLADLLPQVVALHRLQGELRDLSYDVAEAPDLPPTCVDAPTLAHVLLLLFSAAARVARRARGSAVSVACSGDDERITVVIASVSGDAVEDAAAADATPLAEVGAADALLKEIGGELSVARAGGGGSEAYFEIRLPTLASVRRREGRGTK